MLINFLLDGVFLQKVSVKGETIEILIENQRFLNCHVAPHLLDQIPVVFQLLLRLLLFLLFLFLFQALGMSALIFLLLLDREVLVLFIVEDCIHVLIVCNGKCSS